MDAAFDRCHVSARAVPPVGFAAAGTQAEVHKVGLCSVTGGDAECAWAHLDTNIDSPVTHVAYYLRIIDQ